MRLPGRARRKFRRKIKHERGKKKITRTRPVLYRGSNIIIHFAASARVCRIYVRAIPVPLPRHLTALQPVPIYDGILYTMARRVRVRSFCPLEKYKKKNPFNHIMRGHGVYVYYTYIYI